MAVKIARAYGGPDPYLGEEAKKLNRIVLVTPVLSVLTRCDYKLTNKLKDYSIDFFNRYNDLYFRNKEQENYCFL